MYADDSFDVDIDTLVVKLRQEGAAPDPLKLMRLQLQQNVEYKADLTIPTNSIIQLALQKAARERRPVKLQDIGGDMLHSTEFANATQNCLDQWMRKISNITTLQRDPSDGNTLQEVSFWQNYATTLVKIQQSNQSPTMLLMLEILRNAGRHTALEQFQTESTKINQLLARTNDNCKFLSSIPMQGLLQAGSLEGVQRSLQPIFLHLRNIKNSQYPIPRCIQLLQSISSDLLSQLMKIMSRVSLYQLPYAEFEKLAGAFSVVFRSWDDEYAAFVAYISDLAAARQVVIGAHSWNIALAHKTLESRIVQVQRHRAEQLQQEEESKKAKSKMTNLFLKASFLPRVMKRGTSLDIEQSTAPPAEAPLPLPASFSAYDLVGREPPKPAPLAPARVTFAVEKAKPVRKTTTPQEPADRSPVLIQSIGEPARRPKVNRTEALRKQAIEARRQKLASTV